MLAKTGFLFESKIVYFYSSDVNELVIIQRFIYFDLKKSYRTKEVN